MSLKVIFILLIVMTIGILLFKKDRVQYLKYIIFLNLFLEFIINKIFPWATYYVDQMILITVAAGILLSMTTIKTEIIDINFKTVLWITVLSLFYFIIIGALRGVGPFIYLIDYRRTMFMYLIVIIFFVSTPNENYLSLLRFIVIMLIVQIIVTFIQYFGPDTLSKYLMSRNPYPVGKTIAYLKENDISSSHHVIGTLGRYNQLGNLFAMIIPYLWGKYLWDKNDIRMNSKYYLTALIASIITIVLTGNRMSMVSFVFGMIIVYYIYNPKKTLIIILISIFGVLVFCKTIVYIGLEQYYSNGNIGSPIHKLTSIFIFIADPFSKHGSVTTFTLSLTLIPYFLRNPIIGIGNYYRGGYALIYPGSNNVSDATLMFLLCEYGLIGFLVLISIMIAIVYYCKSRVDRNSYLLILTIVAILLVQTITDAGFYYKRSGIFFSILVGFEIMKYRMTKR